MSSGLACLSVINAEHIQRQRSLVVSLYLCQFIRLFSNHVPNELVLAPLVGAYIGAYAGWQTEQLGAEFIAATMLEYIALVNF